jgi:hypothetical protein
VRGVFKYLVPMNLLGGPSNTELFMGKLAHLICLNRAEFITIDHLMFGFKVIRLALFFIRWNYVYGSPV